ncbi:helix-turn-helix transcriptional regulator [Pedobacter borealis]|uniref:helix-turn-helix transcriptional regulator n=1 Tax=Pedobacter borealis TaxID=475254 RepID=UPI0004935ED8|nr:hypothetical protein [Pedobacter borealis]
MNISYTWGLARKILVVFLMITIVSAIVAFVVRNRITQKLEELTKLTNHADLNQSKPEQVLLLLQHAENDFQESLLNIKSKKKVDYRTKLVMAFNQIDTLLKENIDTARLTVGQRNKVRGWYLKKVKLSNELLVLKHNFDSLLTLYSGFSGALNENINKFDIAHNSHGDVDDNTSTVKKIGGEQKKGLFGRIKDAITNKKGNSIIEINQVKYRNRIDSTAHKILVQDKNAYVTKLHQLQQENVRVFSMQRNLIALNTSINNELKHIIDELKEINYSIVDEFKRMAFKNYQEATALLNEFYLAALFLVLLFAILLIIFIVRLNEAERLLRKKNSLMVTTAQQKIVELIKKIQLSKDNRSTSRMEELKEIVQLAISNNPAFLVKFKAYDPEFYNRLLALIPNIVVSEIEFCVLLRLNFQTKEIARYTKTSVRAVEAKKYRIRKKLTIPSDQDINIWMTNI